MESGRTPPPPPPPPGAPPPPGGAPPAQSGRPAEPGQPAQPGHPVGAPAGRPVPPSKGGIAGRRIAALIAALVFAFAGAVMIVASLDLADGPLCEDVAAGTALPEDGECFDVSSTMQTVKTVLTFASGIAAAVVFLAGLFCVVTGRGIRVVMVAAGAAIVLGALGILI
jgi:hypothetical protein